jgi:hypothetical protein
MTAYLQHQLWAIEQATQAEKKYDTALLSMISRAKDERRTVMQESNGVSSRPPAHPPASLPSRYPPGGGGGRNQSPQASHHVHCHYSVLLRVLQLCNGP